MASLTTNRVRHRELNLHNEEEDYITDGASSTHHTKITTAFNSPISKDTVYQPRSREEAIAQIVSNRTDETTFNENAIGYDNVVETNDTGDDLEVICGPLLNYKRMSKSQTRSPIWHGSVLIVTNPGGRTPELNLKCVGSKPWNVNLGSSTTIGIKNDSTTLKDRGQQQHWFRGTMIYADSTKAFWRFSLQLELQETENRWEYTIPNMRFTSNASSRASSPRNFVVPAASQSMRIMFHSCNGFSVGTDEDAWSGPALWNDVMRIHEQEPFHVMIGGGDQIYNDGVRVGGPLRAWTEISNPHKRRDFPFNESLRRECDAYYLNNYIKWFSVEPFATANGQIPQINIWDDHDIIDGFGSYTDRFMRCPVFCGIGAVSFKYYCLFQHHIPPSKSSFIMSSSQTGENPISNGLKARSASDANTFVPEEQKEEPCFIIGGSPGPYLEERSRSLYMQLGARIAFLGVDARTERTRHQVNYDSTYKLIFNRVRSELTASKGVNHLVVLLGVPIAYPRLAWLENIFTSPIIGPIRFLNKRFGVAGSFFNHFDGQVDLLDDLDDHYTARQHKHERKDLVLRLQSLAQEHNVRVTILGGDVHLAAIGRFYSAPKLAIPTEQDHRYMANIISSAITNKPPPKAVANLLARRNKIHHLDHETHETLMNIFDRDPGDSNKTANFNHCTMPSRNYAIITEAQAGGPSATEHGDASNGVVNGVRMMGAQAGQPRPKAKDGHSSLHAGEDNAGTEHVTASGVRRGALTGGLDVSIRVEINQHDPTGKTEGYGFSSKYSLFIGDV